MKDEKLRNVGIYEGKLQEKKGKRRYVGCDVTKRRRKIRASVAERRSTCALCFRKNGPKKIIQKSSVELKTSQKRRKSWRLWFFHSRRNSTKKKEKKEKEIEKSHLASIVQQGHSSLCTLVTSNGWSYKGEFTDRFHQIFVTAVFSPDTQQRTKVRRIIVKHDNFLSIHNAVIYIFISRARVSFLLNKNTMHFHQRNLY